jgi:hypothetical protein
VSNKKKVQATLYPYYIKESEDDDMYFPSVLDIENMQIVGAVSWAEYMENLHYEEAGPGLYAALDDK